MTAAPPRDPCPDCEKPLSPSDEFCVCNACLDARGQATVEADRKARHEERVREWLAICPPEYRSSDWSRPELSPRAADAAKQWWAANKGMGLGLWGVTGRGKSRAMYAILQRHHFAGRWVFAVTSTGYAQAVADQNSQDYGERHEARRILRDALRCGLLLFDDIGKERFTLALGKQVHDLWEYRTTHHLPILWTSERDGESLAAQFGEAYGDGFIRRLRQFSEIRCVNPVKESSNIELSTPNAER